MEKGKSKRAKGGERMDKGEGVAPGLHGALDAVKIFK